MCNSNTATAAMMFPVANAVLDQFEKGRKNIHLQGVKNEGLLVWLIILPLPILTCSPHTNSIVAAYTEDTNGTELQPVNTEGFVYKNLFIYFMNFEAHYKMYTVYNISIFLLFSVHCILYTVQCIRNSV